MTMNREQRVIRAAKAAGVPQSPQVDFVKGLIDKLIAQINQLQRKGMGRRNLRASQVYTKLELTGMMNDMRPVMNHLRSLGAQTTQMDQAIDWVGDAVETLPDADAQACALKLMNAAKVMNGVKQRDLRSAKATSVIRQAKAMGIPRKD